MSRCERTSSVNGGTASPRRTAPAFSARGSRIDAARNYGIDLTLLAEQLRLTPAERVRKLESASTALEQVRGIARRRP